MADENWNSKNIFLQRNLPTMSASLEYSQVQGRKIKLLLRWAMLGTTVGQENGMFSLTEYIDKKTLSQLQLAFGAVAGYPI
ncbi:MAG TPA: hypothetical protein PKK48_09700, partial [Phycisphaerae bacterium]|nr:hypothetical protein [Phycisphaerae bacterium]